ncbi:MAG TPA: HEAT repeat domain-containing protein [Acidimicrobiales bacterium]|nr:HEAT repeat domain-containing protein [Acidimicrobiales bacterium]
MGKYDAVRQKTGWGMPGGSDIRSSASEIDDLIGLTRDTDPKVRKVALANLCPCHVRADYRQAWDRILAMTDDPDPSVRRTLVHMLADGSPRDRQPEVVEALESLRHDSDRHVRRSVNHVLGHYRRTGRINVL